MTDEQIEQIAELVLEKSTEGLLNDQQMPYSRILFMDREIHVYRGCLDEAKAKIANVVGEFIV